MKTVNIPAEKIGNAALGSIERTRKMANHKQHLTFSTVSGLLFGGLAWYPGGFPAVNCLLAGGLCSVGGLLPDIDIKTSRSFQDCMSLTACIASMLIIIRISSMGVGAEMISIIGAFVFVAIKFGLGGILQAFTVHRGLIHSIPFGILCGEIVFLITTGDTASRVLKASGLTLGFFSHLLLDEIYSLKVTEGKLSTKKSFGTALKFGQLKGLPRTIVLYFLLSATTYISFNQPAMVGIALDGALDHLAGWTIRGAQHFETVSQKAQQHLRENTNFRNALPTDPTEQELESIEMQLAMAALAEQEKQTQYTARRQNRYRTSDIDTNAAVPTLSNMPAISNGPSLSMSPSSTAPLPTLAFENPTYQPNATATSSLPPLPSELIRRATPNTASSSSLSSPPPLLSELRAEMTTPQISRSGANQLPPAAPIQ